MATRQRQTEEHDEALPFFTVPEADYFRKLFQKSLVTHGREVRMFPDHAEGDGGGIFGFWNVAADCHKHPRRLWPIIVGRHIECGLIDPTQDFFEGMSKGDVLRNTYVKLCATDSLPDLSWYPYARSVAPGLVELIALHRSRSSYFYRQEDVERFGGLDVLREAGLGNLRILPPEHRETIKTKEGGHFRVLGGDSPFTASRLLTLDRLVDLLFTDTDMPHGVLAAIPTRSEVGVHIIRDDSAIATLIGLVTFARDRIKSSPGQLSPDVYWVGPDHFQQVCAAGRKGVEFRFSPEFQSMMEKVAKD